MLIAISIILGIAFILNIIATEGNINVLIASSLVLSLWTICLPLAIIVIIITGICGLHYIQNN